MLVSHDHKFVFVHVQKTAGISIETVLKQHFPHAVHWHGRHGHAKNGIGDVGPEVWESYYSFAVVRNPWDRLASWYTMIEDAQADLPFWKRSSKAPFKSDLWNQVRANSTDFDSFLDNCTEPVFDLGCWKSFAYNQLDLLTDEAGKVVVDDIGRFETLAADINKVFSRLGIPGVALPEKNVSSARGRHYSLRYTPRTRALVAERFARDIETFGYRFEPV